MCSLSSISNIERRTACELFENPVRVDNSVEVKDDAEFNSASVPNDASGLNSILPSGIATE